MLRKIRLTFAMICFVLITLLFLDFTGTLHGWFGWLAKIQFLPAVLALNVGVILYGAYNEAVFSMVGENGRKALRTKGFKYDQENGLNISKRFSFT